MKDADGKVIKTPCDLCVCTLCKHLTDCPAHADSKPDGRAGKMNRCRAVCQKPFKATRYRGKEGRTQKVVFPLLADVVTNRDGTRDESHVEEVGREQCPHFVMDSREMVPQRADSVLALAQKWGGHTAAYGRRKAG